jgi:hypothetical protein
MTARTSALVTQPSRPSSVAHSQRTSAESGSPGTIEYRARRNLTEQHPAGRDFRQQSLLELIRGVAEEHVADRLDRQQIAGQRQPLVAEALLGGERGERVPAAPAQPLGPVQADPPLAPHRGATRGRVAVGGHALEAVAGLADELSRKSGPEAVRLGSDFTQ